MKAALALLAALVALPTAAVAGPSSAREDWTAVSFEIEVPEGDTWGGTPYSLPYCEDGRFLITHVSAAPSMSFLTSTIADLAPWALSVPVWQGIEGQGLMAGQSLIVAGRGLGHGQVSLPGGQAAAKVFGWVNASQAAVYLGAPAPRDLTFTVHVSGSCGQPGFVAPLTPTGEQVRAAR